MLFAIFDTQMSKFKPLYHKILYKKNCNANEKAIKLFSAKLNSGTLIYRTKGSPTGLTTG